MVQDSPRGQRIEPGNSGGFEAALPGVPRQVAVAAPDFPSRELVRGSGFLEQGERGLAFLARIGAGIGKELKLNQERVPEVAGTPPVLADTGVAAARQPPAGGLERRMAQTGAEPIGPITVSAPRPA